MKKAVSSLFAVLIAAVLCLASSATTQATPAPPPQTQVSAVSIADQIKQLSIEINRDDERIRNLKTLIAKDNHDAQEFLKAAALVASQSSVAAALKKDADTCTQRAQTNQNEVNDLEPRVQKLRDQRTALEALLKQ
jgi:predicted  nucleic acid-binding Zn-ribbon protein